MQVHQKRREHQQETNMTLSQTFVAALAVAACAASGADARPGVAALSVETLPEHSGRAWTQSRTLSVYDYLSKWMQYYTVRHSAFLQVTVLRHTA